MTLSQLLRDGAADVRRKSDLRRRLDGMALAEGEQEGLLDEARTAFRLNAAIFSDLVRAEER